MAADIGRVWARVKETAEEFAENGVFPGFGGAEIIVSTIMRDEGLLSPPPSALELLADEFMKLIAESKYGERRRLRRNAS